LSVPSNSWPRTGLVRTAAASNALNANLIFMMLILLT
jgi:hypothetical protein